MLVIAFLMKKNKIITFRSFCFHQNLKKIKKLLRVFCSFSENQFLITDFFFNMIFILVNKHGAASTFLKISKR
jgi:hypothetical protein